MGMYAAKKSWRPSGLAVLLMLVVAGVAAAFGYLEWEKNELIGLCRSQIEPYMTSPASAKWSAESMETRAGFVEVRGTFDADNAFGAAIRQYYACQILPDTVRISVLKEAHAPYSDRVAEGKFVAFLPKDVEGRTVGFLRSMTAPPMHFSAEEEACVRRLLVESNGIARSRLGREEKALEIEGLQVTDCPFLAWEARDSVADSIRRVGRPGPGLNTMSDLLGQIRRDRAGVSGD